MRELTLFCEKDQGME